jgi:hypothetical protein
MPMRRALILAALLAAAPASAAYRFGLEVGVAGASLTTGTPHRPYAGGLGLMLGFNFGWPLGEGLALRYLNRIPIYVFADEMPGLGVALDCFDFNVVAIEVRLADELYLSFGPSFDFMVPFAGNRAFGGGLDLRLQRVIRDDGGKPRYTLGLFFHPSAMQWTESHDYYSFLKVVGLAGITFEALWL